MFRLFKKSTDKNTAKEEPDKIQNCENSDAAKPYIISELGKIRYEIEHRLIRDAFFNDPPRLINTILREDGIYSLYDSVMKKVGIENPYEKNEFRVDAMKFDADNILVSLELPKPEYVPLCYRMHFACNSAFNKNHYYTIESSQVGGFLCQWFNKDIHASIHEIQSPEWKEYAGLMKGIEANIIIDLFNKDGNEA